MLDARLSQAEKLINLTSKVNSEVSSSKTKLLTITSGKGGVGKSTFTANFAYILSQKNLRVLVLDADIGLANMQVLFDVKPVVTLFDYINGHKKLQEVIIETKYPNLSLIAGKSGYQYVTNSSSFIFSRLVGTLLLLYHINPLPSVLGTNVFGVGVIDVCKLNFTACPLKSIAFTFPSTSNFSTGKSFPIPKFPAKKLLAVPVPYKPYPVLLLHSILLQSAADVSVGLIYKPLVIPFVKRTSRNPKAF